MNLLLVLLSLWGAPTPGDIAQRIRALLADAAPDSRMEIDTQKLESIVAPEESDDWTLSRRSQGRPGGTEFFEIGWLSQGKVVGRHGLQVRVHRYVMAAVACKPLLRGQVLSDSVICREERAAVGAGERAVSADSAIGQRLRRPVPKGHLFLQGELEDMPRVLKGQEVKLFTLVGQTRVEMLGTAQTDAATGKIVRVKTAQGRELSGRVEADGSVQVVPGL